MLKYGNIYNNEISEIKGIYFKDENRLSLTLDTYYQNLSKFEVPAFHSLNDYFKQIVNTDLINYKSL